MGCNSKLLLKCVIGIKSFSAIIYEEKVLSTLIFTFGTKYLNKQLTFHSAEQPLDSNLINMSLISPQGLI